MPFGGALVPFLGKAFRPIRRFEFQFPRLNLHDTHSATFSMNSGELEDKGDESDPVRKAFVEMVEFQAKAMDDRIMEELNDMGASVHEVRMETVHHFDGSKEVLIRRVGDDASRARVIKFGAPHLRGCVGMIR